MSYTEEKQLDLREIWQVVLKRKWLLILPFILVVGISYAGSFLIPARYTSSAIILVSQTQIVNRDIARLLPSDMDFTHMSDRQIRRKLNEISSEVTSGINLAKLITQLGLDENPAVIKKAREMQETYPDFTTQDIVYRMLIEQLRDKISVSIISQNLIRITVDDHDPIKARNISQKLAETYRDEKLKSELLAVRSQLDFSNTQAQIYKKELAEKEEELANFKKNYQKSSIDQSLTTQENLEDIESEIDRTKLTDMVDINDQINFLEERLTSLGINPEEIEVPEELAVPRRLLMDRTTRLAELMEKYTLMDASVNTQKRLVENTIDSIRGLADSMTQINYAGMSSETTNLLSDYISAKIESEYYQHKLTRLNRSKENIKVKFTTGPDADIQLEALEKEVERAKVLYDKFYESYTGSQLAMEIYREDAENRYKIIEPANIPLEPYWPNRIKIVIMGCALGLLLGVGALILAEVTDNSIKKIESIERQLNLKVLGTIPKIEFKEDSDSQPRSGGQSKKDNKLVGSKT